MDKRTATDLALYLINERALILQTDIIFSSGEVSSGRLQALELGSDYPVVAFAEPGADGPIEFASVAGAIVRTSDGKSVCFGGLSEARARYRSAAQNYAEGVKHLQSGRIADGVSEMREVVKLDPTARSAWLNIGLSLHDTDVDAAVEAFQNYLRHAGDGPDDAAYRDFAHTYLEQHGFTAPRTKAIRRAASEPALPTVHAFYEKNGQRFSVMLDNDSGLEPAEVQKAIAEFAGAPTFLNAFLLYEQTPALRSSFVTDYLGLMSRVLENEDERLAAALNHRLLSRARELGDIVAFAEAMQVTEATFAALVRGVKEIEPELKKLLSLPLDEQERVLTLNHALVNDPALDVYLRFVVNRQPIPDAKAIFQRLAWTIDRLRQAPRASMATRHVRSSDEVAAVVRELQDAQGDQSKLSRTIETLRELQKTARPEAASGAADLVENLLGVALVQLSHLDVTTKHRDEGIRWIRRVLFRTDPRSYEHRRAALNLAATLVDLHEDVGGDVSGLDEAIALCRVTASAVPAGTEEERIALSTLGGALTNRARTLGDLASLNEAIEVLESPNANATAPVHALNLARALRYRYHLSGRLQDLDRAVELSGRILAKAATGSTLWTNAQLNRGAALHARGKQASAIAEVDAAIDAYRSALAYSPPSPRAALIRANLANALCTRFELISDIAALDESIQLGRRAAESGSGVPAAREWQRGLSVSLLRRFESKGVPADIENALNGLIAIGSDPLTPKATRRLALANLGTAWLVRYRKSGQRNDIEAAAAFLQRAFRASDLDADPMYTFQVALQLCHVATARHDWQTAVGAGETGIKAAEHMYDSQLSQAGRETIQNDGQTLHAMLAFALCCTGRALDAAIVMERSRGRHLSEALDLRGRRLARLERLGHLDLVHQYREAASLLTRLYAAEPQGDDKALAELIPRTRAALDSLRSRVRAIPGFEWFGEAVDVAMLAAAARRCSIVYICSTFAGGMAVILRANGSAESLLLPALDNAAVDAQVAAFVAAQDRYLGNAADPVARKEWFNAIDEVAGWVGSAGMASIAERLDGSSEAVLIPLGRMAFLPLHAAWVDGSVGKARRWLIDEVALRYSPNARLLLEAQNMAELQAAPGALIVADPQPSSAPRLGGALVEAAAAQRHFARSRTLRRGDATRERFEVELSEANVLHFAGHARSQPASPLKSAILLANDENLSVGDLMALEINQLRLVVISGCQTAVIGTRVPDEVIGLSAGFMHIGAVGVIASMWAVDDASTALLMSKFYEFLQRAPQDPAGAFRSAQRWYRDATHLQRAEVLEPLLPNDEASTESEEVETLYQQLLLFGSDGAESDHLFHWGAFCFSGQ